MPLQSHVNIAILASGSGTNAENIIRYFSSHPTIRVALVISNKVDAGVLRRASRLGVPAAVIPGPAWKEKDNVDELLKENKIDFIVLAGYLLLIPSWMVKQFAARMVNIHPALLPKFGGKGMYGERVHKAVIEAGEKKSGITIHFINDHYDEGDVIFQAECAVMENDTPESLAKRIHALEYEHFPVLIEKVIENTFMNN